MYGDVFSKECENCGLRKIKRGKQEALFISHPKATILETYCLMEKPDGSFLLGARFSRGMFEENEPTIDMRGLVRSIREELEARNIRGAIVPLESGERILSFEMPVISPGEIVHYMKHFHSASRRVSARYCA